MSGTVHGQVMACISQANPWIKYKVARQAMRFSQYHVAYDIFKSLNLQVILFFFNIFFFSLIILTFPNVSFYFIAKSIWYKSTSLKVGFFNYLKMHPVPSERAKRNFLCLEFVCFTKSPKKFYKLWVLTLGLICK